MSSFLKIYHKAVLPLGFKANGIACGIKKSGKPDLALFYSQPKAKASCCFTSNRILAAPILVSKKHLKKNRGFRALIVNSGNANCFTGGPGLRDAEKMCLDVARIAGIKKENVLIASTGIIGRRIPLGKIKGALPRLLKGLSKEGITKAKQAILTTDAFTKEATVKFRIQRKVITLCGVAKGAGMIAPDMATMLAFIFSDANIAQGALKAALAGAVNNSFNCITVDGCMSTNDSVMLLANAAGGNPLIEKGRDLKIFSEALRLVCLALAKMIVRDAEGASKFIQIKVKGSRSYDEAKKAALAIANSNLFKTAMYGEDPNFGRIVASAGSSGIEVREKDLKIKMGPLNKKDICIEVTVGRGNYSATVYTSDLTPEYIRINAEYN